MVRALIPRFTNSPITLLKQELGGTAEYLVPDLKSSHVYGFTKVAERRGLHYRVEDLSTTTYLPVDIHGAPSPIEGEASIARAAEEMRRRGAPVFLEEHYDGDDHYIRRFRQYPRGEPVPFEVKRPPATEEQIHSLIAAVGMSLPTAYLDFLRHSNGAECGPNDQGGDSLVIYSTEELPTQNALYQIQLYLPLHLAFASDGGDYVFCFHTVPVGSPDEWPIFQRDLGDVGPDESGAAVAISFKAWQADGFRYTV